MALSTGKAMGGVATQMICRNAVSTFITPIHMFSVMRCMTTKLFVGGLAYVTDDQTLKKEFEKFGELTEAKVITDRMTGKSRGFGFVGYTMDESASQALSSMDGQELHGRNIRVSFANKKSNVEFDGGDSTHSNQDER